MLRRTTIPACLLTLAASACAVDAPERLPPIETSQAPIQGGYVSETDTHVVGVVRLGNQGLGTCSGTLIAKNVVLTAQHCVAETSTGGQVGCGYTEFYQASPAEEFYVTTNTQFTQDGEDYHQVREVLVPPGGSDFCGNDQAILILADDEPILGSEAVPAIPRVDVPLEPGEEYFAVGFGQTYEGGPSGTRYRRDELFTACVGGDCGSPQVDDREFLGDTGICQGDSGGPAFDLQNRVVGVVSRGGPECSSPIYGSVYGWADWIKDVTAYATTSVGENPPNWTTGFPTDPKYNHPVGETCSASTDCPSNACLNGVCTRACDDSAPCPEGYVCDESLDVCAAVEPEPTPSDAPAGQAPVTPLEPLQPQSSSGCAAGGKDPTKPIPWGWVPFAFILVGLRRRD